MSTITLFHHPFSRAASVVWQLEEIGLPYTLQHVDLKTGQHKEAPVRGKNTMGKLPVLTDSDVVVSETAAIGLYLADRYSSGVLAPALDDKARGAFLRWCFFPAAVIEPASMAKSMGWTYNPSSAGFGSFDDMMETVRGAVSDGPWLLGDRFTMADVILGATVNYMLMFKMMPADPVIVAYGERLKARPANVRAQAVNGKSIADHGLGG